MTGVFSNINTSGGDFAGGDLNKVTYQSPPFPITKIKDLYQKLESEKINKEEFHSCIEKLARLMSPREEEVKGLEAKLRLANKSEDEIDYAKEMKENYSKTLMRHQFYESAQQLHVEMLGVARMCFVNHVYPLIQKKAGDAEIMSALQTFVINPLQAMIAEDTNGEFSYDDAMGMIYYLTGNCFIKWV